MSFFTISQLSRRTLAGVVLSAAFALPVSADSTSSSAGPFAHASGPQLFVGEQYDISGTMVRVVTLPIRNGMLQSNPDGTFDNVSTATVTARPDRTFLSSSYSSITTYSSTTGRVVSSLAFQPVDKNFFPTPSEIYLDAAGRIYVAFYYQTSNKFYSGLAIYPAGASGTQPPYAVLRIPSRSIGSAGVATAGDAVYVSDAARNTINIFAPVQQPRLVGRITGFRAPSGLSFDRNGELYVCNAGNGTVVALPPSERGAVKPDRVISVRGHHVCGFHAQFFGNGNEMTVSGETLFVAADDATRIFELDARVDGPQTPLATVGIPRDGEPWQAIDLSVGPR